MLFLYSFDIVFSCIYSCIRCSYTSEKPFLIIMIICVNFCTNNLNEFPIFIDTSVKVVTIDAANVIINQS